MSEEHHHHHHFGHRKSEGEETPPPPPPQEYNEDNVRYEQTEYYEADPQAHKHGLFGHHGGGTTVETTDVYVVAQPDAHKHEEEAKKKEHRGQALGAAAGAFAVYEHHEIKKDSEHAGRHKMEEKIAETVAVSAGGYALHERHEKKEAEKEGEHQKKHHFF